MDLLAIAIPAGAVIAFVILKQLEQVSAGTAAELLRQGAAVIDVRTPAEFHARHLPGALNIPLSDLKERAPRELPNKGQGLLLHCLSGGRSAVGKRTLKALGYNRVFNLGSYGRAERIVTPAR